MANVTEIVQYDAGVYQLETADPVLGGVGGIANAQAKALANRTAYLKQQVELRAPLASPVFSGTPTVPTAAPGNTLQVANMTAVANAVAALVASSPAALDTLNELATALGNDANFAATINTALASKAPLASPAFTGTPTVAASPALFDATTKLATMAALQRALGNYQLSGYLATAATLVAADGGKALSANGPSALTWTLPASASLVPGWSIRIGCVISGGNRLTINAEGTDNIDNVNASAAQTSINIGYGEDVTLTYTGSGKFMAMGANAANMKAAAMFGVLLSGNGYQKLPSGLIIQWGQVAGLTGGASVNFYMTFPNAVFVIVAGATAVGIPANAYVAVQNYNTATFNISTNAATPLANWVAIGY
jgi:hypothetical protein